jgi:FkbM family methyltransferase
MDILRGLQIFIKKVIGKGRRQFVRLSETNSIRMLNGKVRFECKYEPFLDKGDFKAILTDSYDIILCEFLKRKLADGDIFLDVGANIGYISAVAASYVGVAGEVHGFEPLKECFARTQVLAELNPDYSLIFNNCALGNEEGNMSISYNPHGDSRNATLIPDDEAIRTVQVPVRRLDNYISTNIRDPRRIKIIKIDVEGFELPVLLGLERFLATADNRPLIICEIKPWVLPKIGYTLMDFENYMKGNGYQAYDLLYEQRKVEVSTLQDIEVVLFRSGMS